MPSFWDSSSSFEVQEPAARPQAHLKYELNQDGSKFRLTSNLSNYTLTDAQGVA